MGLLYEYIKSFKECVILFAGLGSEVRNTTVVAAMLSALLLALFVWWFQPGLPVLAGYALLAFVAIFTVPLLYRQTGFTLEDELEWLEEREQQEHEQLTMRLHSLRDELHKLNIEEGASQATRLAAMLEDYHSVVETRFLGKKNSPIAYLSTARRVQKHAIQNLTDVVAVGHSLSSISRNNDRNDHKDSSGGSRREKFERLNHEQSKRLESLLAENRDLFDALTDTAVEVANISSFSEFERLDTLARLVSMSEIASQSGK